MEGRSTQEVDVWEETRDRGRERIENPETTLQRRRTGVIVARGSVGGERTAVVCDRTKQLNQMTRNRGLVLEEFPSLPRD